MEAGSVNRTFTHTYKAATAFAGTLHIVTAGFVIADDDSTSVTERPLSTTSGYAYVYGYHSANPHTKRTPTFDGAGDNDSGTIKWTVDLKKGQSFRTIIADVNVSKTANKYAWTTRAAPNQTDGTAVTPGESHNVTDDVSLYLVETEDNGVQFNSTSTSSIPAASKTTVTFQFTATRTPIRNGSLSFTIPSTWTRPTTEAKKPGVITVEKDANTVFSNPDKPVSTSGWTVTIGIKEMRKTTGRVTVTYGAEGYEATVQSYAETVSIIGILSGNSNVRR